MQARGTTRRLCAGQGPTPDIRTAELEKGLDLEWRGPGKTAQRDDTPQNKDPTHISYWTRRDSDGTVVAHSSLEYTRQRTERTGSDTRAG
jgi:hypothetical protein